MTAERGREVMAMVTNPPTQGDYIHYNGRLLGKSFKPLRFNRGL